MNEQELQGRINGLSFALEIALVQLYTLKLGDESEALRVIKSDLGGLANRFEADGPPDSFRNGTVGALRLIVDRTEAILNRPSK